MMTYENGFHFRLKSISHGGHFLARRARMLLRFHGRTPSVLERSITEHTALTDAEKSERIEWLRDFKEIFSRREAAPIRASGGDWQQLAHPGCHMRRNHIHHVDIG